MSKITNEEIYKKLEEILKAQSAAIDPPMDVKQAAEYLRMGVGTIHKLTSRGEIPFCKPRKKLLFSRVQLQAWMKERESKTNDEVQRSA